MTAMRAAAQNCIAVLVTGAGQAIYSFRASSQEATPCRLVVSGAGGGGFAIIDANNVVEYSEGAYSQAGTPQGTLPAGSVIKQVRHGLHCPGL